MTMAVGPLEGYERKINRGVDFPKGRASQISRFLVMNHWLLR